jgi:FAD/FMN-containing dehydrogenase
MRTATELTTALRSAVHGRVLTADDTGYDDARALFAGGMDRRPASIVRPDGADDVAVVVRAVGDAGLPLAVRGGGHSAVGHGVIDDAVVLDLRDMRALDIDVDGRTAWAQTGLTAGEYTTAAAQHGLATGFGDTGSVGIGGITLGGGVGFLVRKHGMTIDDLLAAEIVTADGGCGRSTTSTSPTCSGRSGAAAGTSARPHDYGSGCTRCRRSWAAS